jgi:hypothetical protein
VISIIKQIQAIITGEANWLRRVWRKYKRKIKYIIYKIKHPLLPSNQAIRMSNTNPPPQISKARSIEGFVEDISLCGGLGN